MPSAARFRPRLGRGRVALLAVLVAVGGLAALLRPAAASQEKQEKPPAAGAVPEEHGGDIVFKVTSKTQKYSVLYSHEKHLDAGLECDECHEKLFKKELNGSKFKMADINQGKFCGGCHTETPAATVKHKAFAPKKNCQKCHTLKVHDSQGGK